MRGQHNQNKDRKEVTPTCTIHTTGRCERRCNASSASPAQHDINTLSTPKYSGFYNFYSMHRPVNAHRGCFPVDCFYLLLTHPSSTLTSTLSLSLSLSLPRSCFQRQEAKPWTLVSLCSLRHIVQACLSHRRCSVITVVAVVCTTLRHAPRDSHFRPHLSSSIILPQPPIILLYLVFLLPDD